MSFAEQVVALDRRTSEEILSLVADNQDRLLPNRNFRVSGSHFEDTFHAYIGLEMDVLFNVCYMGGRAMTKGLIEVPDSYTEQTRFLFGLINQSYQPSTTPTEYEFTANGNSGLGCCNDSELAFAGAVKSLEGTSTVTSVRNMSHGRNPLTIVVDDKLKPIFLKKRVSAPTAMNLQPIKINGVLLPAGMVMDIDAGRADWISYIDRSDKDAATKIDPLEKYRSKIFQFGADDFPEVLAETVLEDGAPLRIIQQPNPEVEPVRQSILVSEDPIHRRALTTLDGTPATEANAIVEREFSLARMQAAVDATLARLGLVKP